MRFAERPVGWLVLTGPSGSGKTHLAAAITNLCLSRGHPTRFVIVPELLEHLRATFVPDAVHHYDDLFDQIIAAPLLVLDDLGGHYPSPWAEDKLDQILTHRYDKRLPTVITSSLALDDMPDRIRARVTDPTFSTFTSLKPKPVQSAQDDHGIEPRLRNSMTFDSFNPQGRTSPYSDEGETLRKAAVAAMSFAKNPNGWLYLSGPTGVGKTHLAIATANSLLDVGNEVVFRFVPDLLDHVRKSFSPSSQVDFDTLFDHLKYAEILILDDFGSQASTVRAEEKLYQLIVHRHNSSLPTVITSRVPLGAANGETSGAQDYRGFGARFSEPILSRLRDKRVVTERLISVPDYRQGDILTRSSDLGVEPRMKKSMTFARFDHQDAVRASQRERETLSQAYEAARSFAKHPSGWLYLAGPTGVGKTHLAVAIANAAIDTGKEVIFRFVPDLLDHMRKSYSPSSPFSYDGLFDRMRNAELLILDDLGSQASTPWAEEKLYQLIVHRHNASLPTVITSRVLLEATDGGSQDSGGFGTRYSEAISSRLRDGLVVSERLISAPDYRFRGRSRPSTRRTRSTRRTG